jgi:predicted nucleotidyltransferase
MSYYNNVVRLRVVARILNNFNSNLIYVGGATVALYATRPLTVNVRETNDVDVAIELVSYSNLVQLQDYLMDNGFISSPDGEIISRYKMQGIILDIMPIKPIPGLSFENEWYAAGLNHIINYTLPEPDSITLNLLSAPYFIASKLLAYRSRGNDDVIASHDMEDIIFVLDNRDEIEAELNGAPSDVKTYLIDQFAELLLNPRFVDSILGNVQAIGQTDRKNRILRILNSFIK